jgi:3(or 17)beta-hydroxysteroid dehydrogenase
MLEVVQGRPSEPHKVPEGVLPPGTLGAPEDVASMVLYLVSDEARFLTGGEFVVDNGATVRA